jgi:hypothetical protein
MKDTLLIMILMAIITYLVIARPKRMQAPETTAQAYRDAIVALGDLLQFQVTVPGGTKPIPQDMGAELERHFLKFRGIVQSTGFLLTDADVTALVNAQYALTGQDRSDWTESTEKALEVLRDSAVKRFNRKYE